MGSSLWFVLCGLGAVWLRAGMGLQLAGMLRSKNSAGGMLRSAVDACVAVLAFWAFGAAILGGAGRLVAWGRLFGTLDEADGPRLFFLMVVTLVASGIVVGVVSERSKFIPMCAASVLLGGVVVPMALRWEWGGWLDEMGFHDFGGAGPIHLCGAACGAVAAVLVGPRMNKYNRDGSSNAIPGHSVPLASAGVLMMFAAWLPAVVGFAGNSTSGIAEGRIDQWVPVRVASNVLLAGAAGMVASLVSSQVRYGKPDIHLTFAGMLGGLVAATAIADAPSAWMAVVTGAVAGVLVPAALLMLDLVWKLDDTTGGVAIHGVGAAWGLVAAGLFAPVASVGQRAKLIGVQFLGIIAIVALAAILSTVVFLVIKKAVGLRSKEADEFDGLDLAEHDVGAYPDFQQTTIKSYHLREA